MQFDKFAIRLLTVQDLEPYFELVEKNRSRLESFFTGTVSRTRTLEDTKAFVADITQRAEAKTYFPYIIINTETGKIIGFLDLKNVDWTVPKSEMGCYMDEDHAGQGIATKAFEIFCDFCFEKYKFEKLFLRTHHSNTSAMRIAEKCGFIVEGNIRRDYKTTAGEVVDLIYYGRVRK